MALSDVAAVVAVERASYVFPWSEGVFRDCIRVGYLCRVVEFAGEVAGYGIMSYGAGEAHILNICIRSDLRSAGVGRRLMDFLLERARAADMRDVFLEVRPSNPICDSPLRIAGLRARRRAQSLLPGQRRPRRRVGVSARAQPPAYVSLPSRVECSVQRQAGR